VGLPPAGAHVLDRRLRLLDDRYDGDGGLFRGRRVLDVGCNYGRVVGEVGEAFFFCLSLWSFVFGLSLGFRF
jgi:hypothetical protein